MEENLYWLKPRTPEQIKKDTETEQDMIKHAIDPLCEYPALKSFLEKL